MESHDIAKAYIYSGNQHLADSMSMMTLPNCLLKDISPMVKIRLTDAGFRLGTLLNQVLDAPRAPR
jgi:anaerobic ribonucleoside-triphosphate reductase